MDLSTALDSERLIRFAQKLVQTPSLSMEEEAVSRIIAREMEDLGYDGVQVDSLHNVVGILKGSGGGPRLLFNGHSDHAGVGGMEEPFSGKIIDGTPFGHQGSVIYGRGAVDNKGAVAAMVQAGGAIKSLGVKLKGDVLVTAVVREEMAYGEGIKALLQAGISADFAVSGEASRLNVMVGHRGKFECEVTTLGRTTHGGYPQGGINAIFKMNHLLTALQEEYPLPEHPFLGKATVTCLDIAASPGALTPIVPDRCSAVIDRRFLPEETEEYLLSGFQFLCGRLASRDAEFRAEVRARKWFPAMFTEPSSPIVQAALEARREVMGTKGEIGAWYFGVDGTFLNQAGIPCVGFGPGNEYLAHTPNDVVPVEDLITACQVYAQLMVGVCG
ncbi:MAG: M20/M25/M40 family metallo-hydrolase [Thermodesulfobacteriota bacterium]